LKNPLPALAVCVLGLASSVRGAYTETINDVSISSGIHVIDSDSTRPGVNYARDTISVDTTVTFTGTGSFTYRYDYQLLDSSDNLILLKDGSGGAATTFQGNTFTVSSPIGKILTESFSPAAQIDVSRVHRVRLLVKVQGVLPIFVTETQGDSATKRLVHFRNTNAADAAANVHGYMSAVRWVKKFACDKDLANTALQAEADLVLYRYDNYLAAAPAVRTVRHRITYQLRESGSGAVVGIADGMTGPGYNLDEFDNTPGFNEPYKRNVTRVFDLDPAGQLDPVAKSYYITAELSHEEILDGGYIVDHAEKNSPAARILHFNGNLTGSGDVVVMTSMTNDPEAAGFTAPGGPSNPDSVLCRVQLGAGFVQGLAAYGIVATAINWDVKLFADGTAAFDDASTIEIVPPATPDQGTVGNVTYTRDMVLFGTGGFSSKLIVQLPAGMGVYQGSPIFTSNHVLDSTVVTSGLNLDQNLAPVATLVSIPATAPHVMHIIEESKPVEITAQGLLWNVTTGEFAPGLPVPTIDRARYVRHFEIDVMNVIPIPAAEKKLYSNELFYQHLLPVPNSLTTWATDANGCASVNLGLDLAPGSFDCHFPHQAKVVWNTQGALHIANDLVVPATSSLPGAAIVEMSYARDCPDVDCGNLGEATVKLDPAAAAFTFTRDGGLTIAGTYIAAGSRRDLVLGYIDALSPPGTPVFAHETTVFQNGRFLMSGHFLDGDDYTGSKDQGPGRLLNTGFDPADANVAERPGTAAFLAGLADYPGMNYRVAAEPAAPTAFSVLGGVPTPTYTLNNRSKYYARRGGVTGIHEPTANPFSGPVMIYGYQFAFTSFGLSFIDSEPHDSITAGSLDVPAPSGFTLAFNPLQFDCLGGLTTARIPGGSFTEDLDFWNADFTGIAANFQAAIGAGCDPSDAYLTLGVQAWASNIASPLAGTLGFKPDGNLITADDALLEGIDSRLGLPSVVQIDGPNDESYNFLAAHGAYYENPDHSSESVGRINLAGYLDVAFFEDLTVHFQTGAQQGNTTDVIHMMGGWIGGNIDAAEFDLDHRSYPLAASLANYRSGSSPNYLIHAKQDWLGVVAFDYPLAWSSSTRTFRATAPVSNDLLVLTTEHELTRLSGGSAELDFGANVRLDIPEINLSNLATDALETSGVLSALQSSITTQVTDALLGGIDSSAELLNDRMDVFYDRIFTATVDPVVETLYDQLALAPNQGARELRVAQYLDTRADSVRAKLQALDGAVGQAGSVVDEVDQALAKLQVAIRTVIGRVQVDNASGEVIIDNPELTVPEDAVASAGTHLVEGIFADANGDGYDLAEILLVALIEDLSPEIAGNLTTALSGVAGSLADKLEDELDARFDEAKPTIDQLKQVLMELHNAIGDIRSAGVFYDEISDQVVASSTLIQDLIDSAESDVIVYLQAIDFEEYSEEEVKSFIRTAIRDRFNASPVIADIQEVLKAHVYDLDASMNEAVSSAFAVLNTIINRLLDDAIPADSSLAGLLGDVSGISAAGSIDGYAEINGDALRTLRLDAALQLKVPEDFEFNGYLEINQLDSFGDGSCSFAGEGEYAAEVKLGAVDVPASWTGDGLRFDVECKFTFDTAAGFALRGFGGSIEMTDGQIGFEAMKVTSLGAAAMFGKDENYLAAEVGLAFDSYELSGGVFFGRTCSVDPLLLVDPDVLKVLGDPPFTGIYAYGEAQIPIVNFSCLFSLSAKAGIGAFWFEEGNTYGGKMVVGATGRALCAVEIGGDVTLIGSKSGNDYSFFGKGRIFGEVGVCPICTEFEESVELTYKNKKWDYDY
jgi:hypothetical protein